MKIVSRYYEEGVKCGSCNWRVHKLFCFEGQDPDEAGMCGECFLEFLEEEDYEAIDPTDRGQVEKFIEMLHEKHLL